MAHPDVVDIAETNAVRDTKPVSDSFTTSKRSPNSVAGRALHFLEEGGARRTSFPPPAKRNTAGSPTRSGIPGTWRRP